MDGLATKEGVFIITVGGVLKMGKDNDRGNRKKWGVQDKTRGKKWKGGYI